MDREEARARMLRLWAAMGDAGGAPVSILTTQQYVRLRVCLLCVPVLADASVCVQDGGDGRHGDG
jgi:hypothetical protein